MSPQKYTLLHAIQHKYLQSVKVLLQTQKYLGLKFIFLTDDCPALPVSISFLAHWIYSDAGCKILCSTCQRHTNNNEYISLYCS